MRRMTAVLLMVVALFVGCGGGDPYSTENAVGIVQQFELPDDKDHEGLKRKYADYDYFNNGNQAELELNPGNIYIGGTLSEVTVIDDYICILVQVGEDKKWACRVYGDQDLMDKLKSVVDREVIVCGAYHGKEILNRPTLYMLDMHDGTGKTIVNRDEWVL